MLTSLAALATALPQGVLAHQSATAIHAPESSHELQSPDVAEGIPYYFYVPSRVDPTARPLVVVHGISRRAHVHLTTFAPFAEMSGRILIAPLFSKARCKRYQQLVADPCRADQALLATLRAVATKTGYDMSQVDLFGFSGGAQFAHRFAMMYPERVGRLAVASAGWYTLPDFEEAFPYGLASIANGRERFQAKLPDFLAIPTLVMVGEKDLARDESLRQRPEVDRRQGLTRVERAARWSQAMRQAAADRGVHAKISFHVLPACGHSFEDCARDGGLVDLVAAWITDP